MGFLGQLILGVLGNVMGGAQRASSSTDGIQSSLGMISPPPMQQNVVGGVAAPSFLQQMLGGVFGFGDNSMAGQLGAGVQGALLKPLLLAASGRAGSANRKFLDAAFPELNAWEKAGASAVSPGIQASAQDLAVKQQQREFAQANKIQDKNIALEQLRLAVQERMNAVSAGAMVQSAGISAAPAMALLPYNQDSLVSQASRMDTETAAIADRNMREWLADIGVAMNAGRSHSGQVSLMSDDGAAVRSVIARDLYGSLGKIRDAGLAGVSGRYVLKGLPRANARAGSPAQSIPRAGAGEPVDGYWSSIPPEYNVFFTPPGVSNLLPSPGRLPPSLPR